MLLIEIIITILFYLILPFYFLERLAKHKLYGWQEKFGNGQVDKISNALSENNSKVIHIHCCSVGETLAVEQLLKSMHLIFSDYKIVLTTFTPAGQEIAKKKFANIADYITYFPFDIPTAVNRFLSKIKPSISIIVETEIWPYFSYSCYKRNIPLIIINARISDKSYGKYKFGKIFFSKIFEFYTAIYAQSNEDRQKFISLGMDANKTEFMGNLKFDIEKNSETIDIGQKDYKIFLAGSTHKPENQIIVDIYKKLREKHGDLKLLIAPRHLQRVSGIECILEKDNLKYGLRSKNDTFDDNTDVIILDTLGELKKMYSICYFAFIGGSFNKTGGHNPLEAAIFEKPIVSGPCVFNFKDIYDILCKSQAGNVVKTPNEMYNYLKLLLESPNQYKQTIKNCKSIFDTQRGAINFVIEKIRLLLIK